MTRRTAKQYRDLFASLRSGALLREQSIRNLKRVLTDQWDRTEERAEIVAEWYELEDDIARDGLPLTIEQNQKGIDWLRSSQLRKDGSIRQAADTFITPSDAEIIADFSHFRFVGFEEFSNGYRSTFSPVYRVISRSGSSFTYSCSPQGLGSIAWRS